MKNVLVTGAGGFIGSHLAEKCVELGYNVSAFIRYNSANNWGWLERSSFKNDMEVIIGDIRDYDSVSQAIQGKDTVFHLAALIGIPYSYVSPLAYIKTNIEGTYNILQAARVFQLENILITSTSETYGTAQYVPIDENHPKVGQSPYAATKISADQLALSFFRSFDLPVKVVRPFNTYGPRQSARAIIPTVITQCLGGEKKLKLGSLDPTRDLTFVKDTVNGFLEIVKSDALFGEDVNIGMNTEISMKELVQLIARLINVEIEILTDAERVRPTKSEVERLYCNNSKLKQLTTWQPQYTLETGLKETISWFENNIQNYKHYLYHI